MVFCSLEPALAALVVLHVAVALACAFVAKAEVELLDVRVLLKLGTGPLQDDAALFHDVADVGDLEGSAGILLDDQNRQPHLDVEPLDETEGLLHEQRRQTQRRLVEHEQPWLGHQRPPDGEHLLLAIGRALMSKPRLLMLDEPSLGLAPLLVQETFGFIKRLNVEMGLTVLVIEQNARRALEIADVGYIMEQGRIVLEGTGAELQENPDVKEFYLGLGDEGTRKSYRDVKHYKRRKRWL